MLSSLSKSCSGADAWEPVAPTTQGTGAGHRARVIRDVSRALWFFDFFTRVYFLTRACNRTSRCLRIQRETIRHTFPETAKQVAQTDPDCHAYGECHDGNGRGGEAIALSVSLGHTAACRAWKRLSTLCRVELQQEKADGRALESLPSSDAVDCCASFAANRGANGLWSQRSQQPPHVIASGRRVGYDLILLLYYYYYFD